jgi:hypothetical protein
MAMASVSLWRGARAASLSNTAAVAGYTTTLVINRAKGISVIALSNGAANPGSLGERALDMLSK